MTEERFRYIALVISGAFGFVGAVAVLAKQWFAGAKKIKHIGDDFEKFKTEMREEFDHIKDEFALFKEQKTYEKISIDKLEMMIDKIEMKYDKLVINVWKFIGRKGKDDDDN